MFSYGLKSQNGKPLVSMLANMLAKYVHYGLMRLKSHNENGH